MTTTEVGIMRFDQDQRLEDLALELEGPDRPGETYLEAVNRIGQAWSTAREMLATEVSETAEAELMSPEDRWAPVIEKQSQLTQRRPLA